MASTRQHIYGAFRQCPLCLFLLAGLMTPVLCSPSEALLYHDLFRNYNRNIRPVQNVSDIIQVNVDLSVINIRDLDFDEGVLDMVSWVSLGWTDFQLKWNPGEYGGVNYLSIPAETTWVPDIVITNLVTSPVELSPTRLVVNNNGRITLIKMYRTRTICRSHRGLAKHACWLKFISWTYNGFQVNVESERTEVDLSEYLGHDRWKVLGGNVTRNVAFYSCCPESFPSVTVNVTLAPARETMREGSMSNAAVHFSAGHLCAILCMTLLHSIMRLF